MIRKKFPDGSEDNQKISIPSYYAIIPSSVRYDNRLSANAKLMYGEITALCSKEGYCWASNRYFSGLYDVREATVSEWIGQLVECGHITTEMVYKKGSNKTAERRIRIACSTEDLTKNRKCSTEDLTKNRMLYSSIEISSNNTFSKEKEEHPADAPGISSQPIIEKTADRISSTKDILSLPKIRNKELLFKSIQLWDKISVHRSYRILGKIDKLFTALKTGKFGSICPVDDKFLSRNKIPFKFEDRKFEDKEILEAIKRLRLLFEPGYWPEDKSSLKKSLECLIYNPRSRSSMFLKVINEKPVSLNEVVQPVDEEEFDLYVGLFREKNGELTASEMARISKGVNSVIKFHKDFWDKHPDEYPPLGSFSAHFGYKEKYGKLCEHHREFLRCLRNPDPSWLFATGNGFKVHFNRWFKENQGWDFMEEYLS